METNEKSRVLDMTKGKPFRLVLKFALPLFFWKSATAVL